MKIKKLGKIIMAEIQKLMLFIGILDVKENCIFVYKKNQPDES